LKELTVDSNMLVAALLKEDKFNKTAYTEFRQMVKGKVIFHASRLVPVEVCGAINRRVGNIDAAKAQIIINSLIRKGNIKVYDLNESRMHRATNIALNYRLRGADAVIVQIAQELKLPIIAYDNEVNKAAEDL